MITWYKGNPPRSIMCWVCLKNECGRVRLFFYSKESGWHRPNNKDDVDNRYELWCFNSYQKACIEEWGDAVCWDFADIPKSPIQLIGQLGDLPEYSE